jgi:ubiquinone/menaquinone biosynthesis C-methylase UbiE
MRATDWDKIAPEYFDNIESPFTKGVRNPIYRLLNEIEGHNKKSVLEVGCGTGTMIPFLSRNFDHVIAIDISRKMIEIAKEKYKGYKNVEFMHMDMAKISSMKKKFDVIVSVNSLIMPNIAKINQVLHKIHLNLKRGGYFVAIFPSFDALIYQAVITYDKEYDKTGDKIKARRATNKIIAKRHHDFCYGFLYYNSKEDRQKHFFGFEILYRLRKAGFKKISIEKVLYPWEGIKSEPNPKRFSGQLYDKLWDWCIFAQKTAKK